MDDSLVDVCALSSPYCFLTLAVAEELFGLFPLVSGVRSTTEESHFALDKGSDLPTEREGSQ